MITKLTIRNLRANTGRFAMTTFGVVLAVSFVVSAFVLGDGLRQTFGNLSTDIVAGTDIEVRPADSFGTADRLDDDDLAAVLSADGVVDAVGIIEAPENSVRPITPDGDEISVAGPPQLAFSWSDNPGFSPLTLVEGDSPDTGEFLIDVGSAATYGFEIDSTYTVVTATGRHELTLSGLTRFGDDNQTLGAVLMSMNAAESAELFGTSGYDSIAVAVSDPARADLAATEQAVQAAVPELIVIDQATLADETASEFNSQVDIVQNILLGFAGVSLLVSIFLIANTFAIVLQQRTREMGLLRLVGADAGQLRRGAMGEAAVIGVLASLIGIPGGIGVAAGLTALFDAIGVTLPAYDIMIPTRTLVVAAAVGIGVTLVAAWWPTRAASRVPAMAALRSGEAGRAPSYRGRTIAAAIIGAAGITAAALGMAAEATAPSIFGVVGGAVALFVAVTVIAPLLVGPVTAAFGVVLERLGMPGRMAVRNARRQAGRTASTATALVIGLAVVSMALVVGESVKTQLGETVDSAVRADYILSDQASEAGFPTAIVDEIAADPAFGAVTGFRSAEMQVDDEVVGVAAADFAQLPELLDLSVSDGGFDTDSDATPNGALVHRDRAEADLLTVGSTVDVLMESGVDTSLVITGIFDDDALLDEDWLVDVALFDNTGVTVSETWIAFSGAAEVSEADLAAAVDAFEQRYPQGELETAGEFRERIEGLIDQILSVLNVMVALAVIIALIGIANTLALSIAERTREIGLVRAVGMSGRGVRRMVRYESAVIAAFGALLGVGMGIVFGYLAVEALPDSFAGRVAVPGGQIVVLVAVAAVAGLIAALLPARRAGRMNVLAAIAG